MVAMCRTGRLMLFLQQILIYSLTKLVFATQLLMKKRLRVLLTMMMTILTPG